MNNDTDEQHKNEAAGQMGTETFNFALGLMVVRALQAAAQGPAGGPAPPGGLDASTGLTIASDNTEAKDTVSALPGAIELDEDTDLKQILDADAFIKEEDLELEMKKENEKGRGGFGTVYIGKLGGLDVAVKVMTQKSRSSAMAKIAAEMFCQEVALHRSLRHPRILSVIGVCRRDDDWLLVTEFCAFKSVRDFSEEHPVRYRDFAVRKRIALQTAQGMAYLHEKNVLHLDLKPENLLMDADGNVKVADFGISKKLNHTMTQNKPGGISLCYVPPEVVLPNTPYGKPADVYSFGVILYELLTSEAPWVTHPLVIGKNPMVAIPFAITIGERPRIPAITPKAHREVIELCWHQDAAKRPSFVELCAMIEAL